MRINSFYNAALRIAFHIKIHRIGNVAYVVRFVMQGNCFGRHGFICNGENGIQRDLFETSTPPTFLLDHDMTPVARGTREQQCV
jgi:hypothetical protein